MSATETTQEPASLLGTRVTELSISQESRRLLAALQQSKVRFAHWKSNGHLLEALAGKTDLDLLVYPPDRAAFEQVMRQLSYKQLKSQPWSSYPQVEDWIGLDPENGALLHIHTHYALVTGIKHVKHLYLPWLEEFFQQVHTDAQTGWPIPRPEMEAIILLIRMWAKTPPLARLRQEPDIPLHLQAELLGLLEKADPEEMVRICARLQLQLPPDFQDRLRQIRQDNDTRQMRQLGQYLYGQLKPYYRRPWPAALLQSFGFQFLLKILARAARYAGPFRLGKTLVGGGKVIALVGCDGSGKSTLSADILRWLTYKIDTHYFYLGKNPFIRSYQKTMVTPTDIFFGSSRVSRLLRRLLGDYYFVLLIRKKRDLLLKAHALSRRGSVVICDRFPQQEFFGLNDGPNLQKDPAKKLAAQEMRLFNQVRTLGTDLIFRLRVSPEVAHNRKPEHGFEKIKMKSESISQVSFTNALVINVDADKPYHQVLLEVKKEIWKHL